MIDSSQVTHDPDDSRFEYRAEGFVAELVYRRHGQRMVLLHTGVPETLEGHGVGGELVRAAVGYAATQGLTVVPACPFARAWLDRHPDVAALVPIDAPA
ncbi:MAG TPA: GNAT family N-acetyltransferase [Streptosporangiaceae bacterium]|nr:GNAT family N-acetyltransferase [Streptosporangiaceae bacterium]